MHNQKKPKHWGENLCKINMNGKWGDGYPFCNYLLVTGDTQRGNVVSAKKQEIAKRRAFEDEWAGLPRNANRGGRKKV